MHEVQLLQGGEPHEEAYCTEKRSKRRAQTRLAVAGQLGQSSEAPEIQGCFWTTRQRWREVGQQTRRYCRSRSCCLWLPSASGRIWSCGRAQPLRALRCRRRGRLCHWGDRQLQIQEKTCLEVSVGCGLSGQLKSKTGKNIFFQKICFYCIKSKSCCRNRGQDFKKTSWCSIEASRPHLNFHSDRQLALTGNDSTFDVWQIDWRLLIWIS